MTLEPLDYWETKAKLLDFQRREQQIRAELGVHAAAYNQFWRETMARLKLNPENSQVEFVDATYEVVQTPGGSDAT